MHLGQKNKEPSACVFMAAATLSLLLAGCSRVDDSPALDAEPPPAVANAAASRPPAPAFDPKKRNLLANALALDYYRLLTGHPDAPPELFPESHLPTPVDAGFLHSQSMTNVAVLDRDLDGKRVLLREALVTEITAGPRRGWYTIGLPGGSAVFESDQSYVANLAVGQPASMVCTYEPGNGGTGFLLVGCRGLMLEAETYGSMAALAPSMLGAGEQAVDKMKIRITDELIKAHSQCTDKVSIAICYGDVEDSATPPDSTEKM